METGDSLRLLRTSLRIRLDDVARELGVSRARAGQIERHPNRASAQRFAAAVMRAAERRTEP